jgi:replicative superfamily II helicase
MPSGKSLGGGFMPSYLRSLRRAPTPLALTSRADLVGMVKAAHVALLQQSVQGAAVDVDTAAIADLRRYALWLEDVAFADPSAGGVDDDAEREELFSLAATIYEFVARLSSEVGAPSLFAPPLNDYVRSAILSSFTPYQAHATLIGRRVRIQLGQPEPKSPTAACHHVAAATIAALLGREFHQAFVLSSRLTQLSLEAVRELRERGSPRTDVLELDRALALGRVCGMVAAGMLVGIPKLLSDALARLAAIQTAAVQSQDAQRLWLAERLHRIALQMQEASVHRLLGQANFPDTYRHALARDHYFEFWEPQRKAIAQGLVDDLSKHVVVSVPTGAGKTLFAELCILAGLRDDGWAIYVAPSRALVAQVSTELRHRLERCGITVRTVIAGAEQSLVLDDELLLLQMNRTVTVTTPEKLDAYYRNARTAFATCRLLIIDEAHKLADSDRGALLESLITRFLIQQPATRIALLSGMIGNVEEMQEWLGTEATIAVAETRRPTRQVFGIAVRHPPVTIEAERQRRNGDVVRNITFPGGFVVVHEQEDLTGPLTVDLPAVFRGRATEQQEVRRGGQVFWREMRNLPRSNANDHAIETAQALAQSAGTVLVFVHRVLDAERCCRDTQLPAEKPSDERRRLAAFLAAELGSSHPLVESSRRGVAFHHSRLPTIVQRAIELGLERGWLRIVYATATLREGINSAATSVVIAGLQAYDEATQRPQPIPVADFLNFAGRAGRPRVETEGRVLLVPDSLAQATVTEQAERYILSGTEALRVRSQLNALARALTQADVTLENLSPAHQALVLALEAADMRDAEQVAAFFHQSLWASQEENPVLLTRAPRRAAYVLERARETIGEVPLRLASQLGLSLTSAELLRRFVDSHRLAFTGPAEPERVQMQLRLLLEVALSLPEIGRRIDRHNVAVDNHLVLVEAWIAGASYQELLTIGEGRGVLGSRPTIADAVRYTADVSTWLSWAFGAAHAVISATVEDPDPSLGILPLLVRYGVPDAAAAYVALLGITDRVAARVIGQAATAAEQAGTLSALADWLGSIEARIDDVLRDEDHGLRAELVKRQLLRDRGVARPMYRLSRYRALANVALGTMLVGRIDGRRVLFEHQRRVVGELVDVADMLALPLREREAPLGISLSSLEAEAVGSIALVSPMTVM